MASGKAAHERHRKMRVRVDKAGHKHLSGAVLFLAGKVHRTGASDIGYTLPAHEHEGVFEYGVFAIHRDDRGT
ncbi:hypothetical protein SDC9_139123 [bioreactor metagenome]|uniref:Uncharacterized protein n=1 Tax=bioreactor metagenome TaxID=1076179 RepID=A0A645DRU7_9ZZZZ